MTISPPQVVPVMFWQDADGRAPVRDWLKTLSAEDQKFIAEDIRDVGYSYEGNALAKSVRRPLCEITSYLPDGRMTGIFYIIFGHQLLLLHAYVKDTPKAPKPDMDIAWDMVSQEAGLKKAYPWSSLDSWLREEGIYESVTVMALRRALMRELTMRVSKMSEWKDERVPLFLTLRALDMLPVCSNLVAALQTLNHAAQAIDLEVHLNLVDAGKSRRITSMTLRG